MSSYLFGYDTFLRPVYFALFTTKARVNLCDSTMQWFARTTHEGLQGKLDKSAARREHKPGAKVQKNCINSCMKGLGIHV